MPSKYSRKSRDRRGGHETSEIVFASGSHFNGKAQATPVTRAVLKHLTKKVARRQAKNAVEQELAWEAWANEHERNEAKVDSWLARMAEDAEDYYEYLEEQDEEARRQNACEDDSWYDPYYDDYDHYDHNPYSTSHSRSGADRLTSQARQYSHLAAGTLVTEADVGKTVYQVLEEAYERSYEDRYSLSAW